MFRIKFTFFQSHIALLLHIKIGIDEYIHIFFPAVISSE